MRNTELLQQVMQYIDDHPKQHDQSDWYRENECGTTACFAGWACILTGHNISASTNVRDTAIAALGLTSSEAWKLFFATNTRDTLRLMVKDLVNGDELLYPDQYGVEAER